MASTVPRPAAGSEDVKKVKRVPYILFAALAAGAARADDLWIDAAGNGVPGALVVRIDGTPGRLYALVLAGSLQEQTVLGVQVHVDLSWLFVTSAVPGFVGVLDAGGIATAALPIPSDPLLVGAPFFVQAFLLNPLDSASNWCGVLLEPAPGSGPGSGLPTFHHRQGGILHGVHFLDAEDGWTAEDGGRIRVAHDGGATWTFQRTPDGVRAQLRGIFFLDNERGWAVGDGGVVVRTTNGGCLWTEALSVPTTADLYQVEFVSPTQGWIVGKEGALLASADGGETWTSQAPACLGTEDLYGLEFTSPTTGFAAGDEAIVLRTTDGGQTWTSVPNPFNPTGACPQPGVDLEWWAISFASPTVGWISGGEGTQDGQVIVTSDGGLAWVASSFCSAPGPATLYGVAAKGGGGAVAVGYGNGTFVAPAPGVCFADATAPGVVKPPLFGASAPSDLEAWSVGMFGAIRHSANGGLTWQSQTGPTLFRLLDGHFLDATTGWIAGQGYGIARTTDGGLTFQPQFSQNTGNFVLGIAFADAQHGCAVGQAGFVRATADGGASWLSPPSIPTAADLADVTFVTPTVVVAVGAGGVVLVSFDAGATWSATTLPGNPHLEAVAFSGPSSGLAVGAAGAAFRFSGGSWAPVATGTTANLHGVALASPNVGWAVGDGGLVLSYTATAFASSYVSPTGHALHAVEALPTGEVYAAGDFGLFVHHDGAAWSEPKSRTSIPLRALSFLSPTSGWAVGITGLVMRYEPE